MSSWAQPLAGRNALVTGASQGVGKGIALALAAAGANVAINFLSDEAQAQAVVTQVAALGVHATAIGADVRKKVEVDRMFEDVLLQFPTLDILVNNAGVQTWKPLLDLTEDEWDSVIDTNLKGTFLCTQRAAILMKERGGSIINLGSGSSKLAFPRLVAYTTSKGGIDMFTKAAALELGPYQIRVNCIAPGAIEIERTRLEAPDFGKTWGNITPLGRAGTPEDVGLVAVFLASEAARFVSGQTLWVDGGVFSRAIWPY